MSIQSVNLICSNEACRQKSTPHYVCSLDCADQYIKSLHWQIGNQASIISSQKRELTKYENTQEEKMHQVQEV